MVQNITYEQLKSLVAPNGNRAIIEQTVAAFNKYNKEFGLDTPLRASHFLAQIAHESAHFNTTKEYGGSKTRYAPWYGRGLIQTTWEENYKAFYTWCVKRGYNPPNFLTPAGREQVAEFPWAFLCSVWYWESRNLNALADKDDVRGITKKINGGYNGLDDRITKLNKAKKIFGTKPAAVDVAPGTVVSPKKTVKDVQDALNKKGFKVTADGVAGPQTVAAVMLFQKYNGLVSDGVVGPKTAKALFG